MEKNSQKKGSPKGGTVGEGVKNLRLKDLKLIGCNEVEVDCEKLFFSQTGLCPYRSKNKKAYKAWLNEMYHT